MDAERAITWGTVLLVVAVAVASGPLVGVDLTAREAAGTSGPNRIELAVEYAPDRVAIERGRFEGGIVLRAPDAVVRVESVSGEPLVRYSLRIPALGYAQSGVRLVREREAGGRVNLSLPLKVPRIDVAALDRPSYRGEVAIRVQNAARDRTLYRRNVTVAVDV